MRLTHLQFKVYLIFLFTFYLGFLPALSAQEQGSGWIFLPWAIRPAGVGEVYGVVGGYQSRSPGGGTFLAGKSIGKIDGEGLLLGGLSFWDRSITVGMGVVRINELRWEVSYTRGMAEDQPVLLFANALGGGISLKGSFWDEFLTLRSSLVAVNFVFEHYENTDLERIEFPGTGLSDLNSSILTNEISLAFWLPEEKKIPQGLRFGVRQTDFHNATKLSETRNLDWFLAADLPLWQGLALSMEAFRSDATVTRQAIVDKNEILSTLDVDCDTTSSTAQKTDCETLRTQLTDYISAHNEFGTARPLGGSRYLRAYREGRFRAAHTRYSKTELSWTFSLSDRLNGQLGVFRETGEAADQVEDLPAANRSTEGAGFRLFFNGISYHLEYAKSDDSSEWHLMLGGSL